MDSVVQFALVDPTTNKIFPDLLPDPSFGAITATARIAATIGTGFTVPSWGRAPGFIVLLNERHLAGHLQGNTSNLVAGAVLLTGTFTNGARATAVTDSGVVLLRATATQVVLDQILSGSAPAWLSFDGTVL